MKIALGSDHAGFAHRGRLAAHLKSRNIEVLDLGCPSAESCDYPEIAGKVAEAVMKGRVEKGILICGTGVGVSIAANKFKGIRAACCWTAEVAALISQHNMANIICLPGRFASVEEMAEWIDIWLSTPHSSEPRHINRIKLISEIEKTNFK